MYIYHAYILCIYIYIYMCIHYTFTEKIYGANVGGPSKSETMHD